MPGFEVFGDKERAQVQDVLDSGVLMRYGFDPMRNGHHKAAEFEERFAEVMDVNHCQMTTSGTTALTVALAAAGVGAGDEVIMPTFTFVASFESILALGAVPILCEVDDTLCLDASAVEQVITDKTRVIMPVHMCGSMADLDPLIALSRKHNLILLEDACQAIGGTYDGKRLGTLGDLGCFSFDFVKTITCGEGGAVITNNDAYADVMHMYTDHGHDHVGTDRGAESHPFLGYNYRISELHAAVGLGQLDRFDSILEKQKENYDLMAAELQAIKGITLRTIPAGATQNHSFFNFFLEDEASARKAAAALKEHGVPVCFYWYDNNWHYHRKWDHLKNPDTLMKLPAETRAGLEYLENATYPQSDYWLGRNISCLVKVGWTADETRAHARSIVAAINEVL